MSTMHDRDCRAFARDIERHVAERRAGRAVSHAAVCADCARRLRLAAGLANALRVPPAVPPEVQAPGFLEHIHERVLDAFESGPLGDGLRAALRAPLQGHEPEWPLQTTSPVLAGAMQPAASGQPSGLPRTPGWLWTRVRFGMRRLAQGSVRQAQRRAALAAAAIVLVALLGWKLGRADGTSSDVQIVFVPVTERPPVMHPVAILSQGSFR
jgi:hypothetical protein